VTCVQDVRIGPEAPEDCDAIAIVIRRAFQRQPAVADMVAAIRRSSRYRPALAFVAHCASELVGFVMLSGTDLVDRNGVRREVLTLTPLAVRPDHQRRGIGSALVSAALHAAERRGEPLVVLEGSPGYYGRLGFRFAGDHGITIDLPDWAPGEAAQVFFLQAYDPAVRGHVQYPPAIADVTG
jgi:putative acetyltransferase